ncbi:MAG TPA: PIG-L deacetylase family protein [Chloroflexia bacterium]|nr:PIG-L deacetylase family protein [Chloroflexia bacterium]
MTAERRLELEIPRSALAIVAHPDDTEFGCSGTVAKWAKAGCEVTYLLLTSGDKGTEDPAVNPEELGRIREAEQLAAAKILGVKNCVFLRYGDGELEYNLRMRGEIVKQIRRFKPESILTWDPLTRNYRMHPDHRITGQLALEAAFPAAMMPHSYPEQLREEGLTIHRTKRLLLFGTDSPDYYVDISQAWDLKLESLKAHASQFVPDPKFMERLRKRHSDFAEDFDFEYAEAFKLVEL